MELNEKYNKQTPPDWRFPEIQWQPVWPVHGSSLVPRALMTVIGLIFLAAAVVSIVHDILDGSMFDDIATFVGSLGGAVMLAAIGVAFLIRAGISNAKRSSGATRHTEQKYGTGVLLRPKRTTPIIYFAMIGCAIYGISSWYEWDHKNNGSALLPSSRDNHGGALAALIFGVGSIVILVIFPILTHWKFSVAVYPDGIQRRGSLPFGPDANIFVAWDDIETVRPGEFRPSAQSKSMPTVEIVLREPRKLMHRLDSGGMTVALPIYGLACEPNTAIALLKLLATAPDSRPLLTRSDAPHWFTPPPLTEQRQLSAQLTKGGSGSR